MEQLGLHIFRGLHAGAVINLSDCDEWSLGAGDGVDILLGDEGVANIHGSLQRDAEDGQWRLTSCEASLIVCGVELAKGAFVNVRIGTVVDIGRAAWELVHLQNGTLEDDSPKALPVHRTESATARRHVLRQLHRRTYLFALMKDFRCQAYMAVAIILLVLTWWWVRHSMESTRFMFKHRQQTVDDISRRFPDAHAKFDASTGITTYSGYVDTQHDLDYLRTVAIASDQGQSVIRVVPMQVLALDTSMLLEEYYRDADVTVTGPGTLRITLPSDDAVKSLAGWDFSAIGALVRRELPEVRDVSFAVASAERIHVDVPRSALEFSVLPTPNDIYFAISANGERLFPGALTSKGTLTEIGPCGLELAHDSSLFVITAQQTYACERSSKRATKESTLVSDSP